MSTLFETITRVQPPLPGWCVPLKAEALAAMVLALRPEVSVEIGIFGGSSFIPLALAHKEIGMGILYGIDPWDKNASIHNEIPVNVEWWAKQDYEKLYGDFMQVLVQLGLETCTRIIRQRSDEVEPPARIDLLHIDGSHTDQATRDVQRFATSVRIGGLCIMDDIAWPTGEVRIAEQRLIALGFKKLYPIDTGAVYQRLR